MAPNLFCKLPGPLTHPKSVLLVESGGEMVPCEESAFYFEGEVYTDGSAAQKNQSGSGRAGWAAIQVDADFKVAKAAYGPVPAISAQTSGAAEWLGIVKANQFMRSGTIHSDYQSGVGRVDENKSCSKLFACRAFGDPEESNGI